MEQTRRASQRPIVSDILVIGAGMAGLYSTWRLLRNNRDLSINIVEMLDRTGGRLDTDIAEIDGIPVKNEEGGMRFMYGQRELIWLLWELGLQDQVMPFQMGDDNNVYYLRGRRFTFGEAKANPGIWSELYNLNERARGKQPGEILQDVVNSILLENGQDPRGWDPTPDDWTQFRLKYTYKGIPTYRWGFWALLYDYGLTQDCIEMLYQSSGFIAPYDQMINAGCAFQLLVDFVDPQFHTLRPGYQLLPYTLAEQVQQMGASIYLKHKVRGFRKQKGGKYLVSCDSHGGGRSDFLCDKIILGTTQRALTEMVPYTPLFRNSPQFLRDIDSVTDMPLGKINLYYDERWWFNRLRIANGGSFTDLPFAQFYCYNPSVDTNDHHGPASMTVYTDYYRSNYWSELQQIGEPYQTDKFPKNPANTVPASTAVVEEATRQMKEMFGLHDIPMPVLSTYKRWANSQMGDGDHQWRIGVNDVEVRERMMNPFPGIYICGESYCDDQTWVNGALRSVEQMLKAFPVAPLDT